MAAPAFDRKQNKINGSTEARLLGVAATDVPIDDIKKLTFPYKVMELVHQVSITFLINVS